VKTGLLLALVGLFLLSSSVTAQYPPPGNYPISSFDTQLQNEEQIWICPTDSTVIIANWRDFRLGYRQIGMGRSWIIPDFWTDSLLSPAMQVFSWQSDPNLTADRNGNFYMSVLDYQPGNHDDSSYISVYKSTDKGISWTGPVTVVDTIGPYFEDKQFTVTDWTTGPSAGNVYMAWARFPNPTRIMFARSTDGGASFDDTVVIGPVLDDQNCGYGQMDAGQFACPLVGSDGSVYVCWIGNDVDSTGGCGVYYSLKIVKSTDGGVTFSEPQVIRRTYGNWGEVEGGVNVYNQPTPIGDVSGGPYDGNLYIAYASVDLDNSPAYDYNVEFIRSADDGTTWSEPIYVNDDLTGLGAVSDQFHPWMVCNTQGTLAIIWYDQRTDLVNHTLFDAYAAYSFDGGETFTKNHRISQSSIDPSGLKSARTATTQALASPTEARAPMAGLIAEYIGISSYNDYLHAAWTSVAGGDQNVTGANWAYRVLAPRLMLPADGGPLILDNQVFDWATSWKPAEDTYQLQISQLSNFTTTVLDVEVDTAYYEATPGILLEGSTYYWRVRAYGPSGEGWEEWSGWSDTWSFTAYINLCVDTDGDGFGDPWVGTNTCPPDNCPFDYNPAQIDTDGDGSGDVCDLSEQYYDTVSTGCTQLTVGNTGNFGDDADYGSVMDYSNFGDCDPTANLYLYDGSPLVSYIDGNDTIAEWTAYDHSSYFDVDDLNPTAPTVDGADYQVYHSGGFVNHDSTLGLEKSFWAPKQPDSCNFIITRTKIFSYDGLTHAGLNIGEYVDWDIPSDDPGKNYPGYSSPHNLVFLQGLETNGTGCQSNENRWGGNAFLAAYLNDTCVADGGGQPIAEPYGYYLADNLLYLYPSMGLVPSEVYEMMSASGFNAYPGTPGAYDYHAVMTYVHDFTLETGDTLEIYAALVTVENGPIEFLLAGVDKAGAWMLDHLRAECGGCCVPPIRGNADGAGDVNVSDLTFLVGYLFQGAEAPPCEDEGDVDGSGATNVSDLTFLVAYLFQGGPPPAPC